MTACEISKSHEDGVRLGGVRYVLVESGAAIVQDLPALVDQNVLCAQVPVAGDVLAQGRAQGHRLAVVLRVSMFNDRIDARRDGSELASDEGGGVHGLSSFEVLADRFDFLYRLCEKETLNGGRR